MNGSTHRVNPARVEQRTQSLGREIFERVRPPRHSPLGVAWWEERLMDWCMSDEALKVQMLRYVDVFPMLRCPETITRYLCQYFPFSDDRLPRRIRWGGAIAERLSPLRTPVAGATRWGISRTARRFICGATIEEALRTLRRLEAQGMAFTVDILGEATISEEEATRYTRRYIDLIEGLGRDADLGRSKPEWATWGPRVNVSVKLSALDANFDPIDPEGTAHRVKERMREILRAARRHRAFINLDMEQYACQELTLKVFRELLEEDEFADLTDFGIVLQAYLRDAPQTLAGLMDWARNRDKRFTVRLVKGAYWDYETIVALQRNWPIPVFQKKWQSDAQFERMVLMLLENHDRVRLATGSHNIRSIAYTLAAAEAMKVPSERVEIQMLYGMGDPIKAALVQMGHFLRIYTPFGEMIPGMAYLIRRILENTANESFLKQSFFEGASVEELLRNPLELEEKKA